MLNRKHNRPGKILVIDQCAPVLPGANRDESAPRQGPQKPLVVALDPGAIYRAKTQDSDS